MQDTKFNRRAHQLRLYFKESLYGVVLQKSISAQIHLLIVYTGNSKEYVDGFVRELIFGKPTL